MAWPCGLASTTDTWGALRVACPHGVDSLTLVSEGHHTATVQLEGRAHVDVWLEPLGFSLSQATVSAVRHVEPEGQTLDTPELMQALDNTPGLQSLDLGAGMIQPVVRGLFGSRVAVLEDGVPQQGGRWGSDHGVLVAPELQVASSWVPGGGQVWMGPEAVAGDCVFNLQASSTRRDSTPLGAPGSLGPNPSGVPRPASRHNGRQALACRHLHVGVWGQPSASTGVHVFGQDLHFGNRGVAEHGWSCRPRGVGAWALDGGRASRVLVHEGV